MTTWTRLDMEAMDNLEKALVLGKASMAITNLSNINAHYVEANNWWKGHKC